MTRQIALSTMWAAGRFDRLSAFCATAHTLGFHCFELNYQVTPGMLDLQPGQEEIVSVHHPCPVNVAEETMDQVDLLLSSPHPARRAQAVSLVKQTIDLAQAFEARVVVLHLGQVNLDKGLEADLRELHQQGRKGTAEYEAQLERLMAAREARAEPHFQAVLRSLQELSTYAERRGLRLGLENPFHYYQIPTLQEMKALLERLDERVVCYWHDVGHAQGLENLGFVAHEEWLHSFASRMMGIHLHDIKGLSGHHPVGTGQMDFALVRKYLSSNLLMVCEFRSKHPLQAVQAALEVIYSWS